MSSVLLSLSLSMFAVAQALTSLIQDCIELSSSDILSGGAELYAELQNVKNCLQKIFLYEIRRRTILYFNNQKHHVI